MSLLSYNFMGLFRKTKISDSSNWDRISKVIEQTKSHNLFIEKFATLLNKMLKFIYLKSYLLFGHLHHQHKKANQKESLKNYFQNTYSMGVHRYILCQKLFH